ncbi:Acyl-CoA carboxylase epsilon subunit [Streptomyces sp. yr375]|uniref:acyl-CoA carboxylase epsilon subunit n=1 Tax=Streptomyces sp. yr375 TaxID=1761906 RepID=UPI0008B43E77|nr:acyl-CoA carboxylase epsilon subunit [Streptomyces sp. yr375]SEQ07573.1 Acyl-CoA carboxylase epsilon subunit [Streptomyces sp. yr375]
MSASAAEDILRVEKGHARSEEIAAITVVLLARAAARARAAASEESPGEAGPHPLDRGHGFRAAHSWRG